MKRLKDFKFFESQYEDELADLLDKVRKNPYDWKTNLRKPSRNFEDDYNLNQEARQLLTNIFSTPIENIHVIRDMKAVQTGNLFFEYESRGKPSGIATIRSKWTFVFIDDSLGGLFLETRKLRNALKTLKPTHTRMGGDDKTSKGILISIKELMKITG